MAFDDVLDCLVVGGGPAGLTASLYLARYERRFALVDSNEPRAAAIPTSHNIPFFPQGISGRDLLARSRETLARYAHGAQITGRVTRLEAAAGGPFRASVETTSGTHMIEARRVILCTGATDVEIGLPGLERAVARGLVRYCPICDGFEARGRRIGVIGRGAHALSEAIFIARTYESDVTLLMLGPDLDLDEGLVARANACGVAILPGAMRGLRMADDRILALQPENGEDLVFDTLYSALGLEPRTELVRPLGVELDARGAVRVDAHQQTSMRGLYAAGGVVEGLDQVVVAMGQAAIAATHAHNHCDETPDEV